MYKFNKKQAGFTLIELLVVIAIIGILCSILIPSISKAREKMKSTVCLNNLRSMAQANYLHEQSNNNQFVPSWSYDGANYKYWFDKEYLAGQLNVEIGRPGNPLNSWWWDPSHLCPTSHAADSSHKNYKNVSKSYGHNNNYDITRHQHPWRKPGTTSEPDIARARFGAQITNPQAAMFVDSVGLALGQQNSRFSDWITLREDDGRNRVTYRHNSKANYVSFDGSAKSGSDGDISYKDEAWQTGL